MKFQVFALVLVVAAAYALPPASDVAVDDSPNQPGQRFVVERRIRRAIDQISREIKDAGLDPVVIENKELVYRPIPFLVQVKAFIRDLQFSGASDIRVHSLNYNILLNRLRFDISLPQLKLTIGDSGIQSSIFFHKLESQLKGSLLIKSIRLSGEIRVKKTVISGISLRSVSLNFRLGDIRSMLSLSVHGDDLSDSLNNIFNESIPKALEENKDNINRRLEDIVKEVFNRVPSLLEVY